VFDYTFNIGDVPDPVKGLPKLFSHSSPPPFDSGGTMVRLLRIDLVNGLRESNNIKPRVVPLHTIGSSLHPIIVQHNGSKAIIVTFHICHNLDKLIQPFVVVHPKSDIPSLVVLPSVVAHGVLLFGVGD
jgi:hypothetical protein